MKYKFGILTVALLGSALLPMGCNRNDSQSAQQKQQYNQQDYEVWVGPGWYYGVYYSDEGRYRNWRRGHRGYGRSYHRGGRSGRHYGNRGYRGGRDQHHGGGRRGGRGRR